MARFAQILLSTTVRDWVRGRRQTGDLCTPCTMGSAQISSAFSSFNHVRSSGTRKSWRSGTGQMTAPGPFWFLIFVPSARATSHSVQAGLQLTDTELMPDGAVQRTARQYAITFANNHGKRSNIRAWPRGSYTRLISQQHTASGKLTLTLRTDSGEWTRQ